MNSNIASTNPNKNEDRKLHIVMLPWLAFGHIIPWLQLAKLIAQKGHRISFVSTPRNIDRLPPLPPSLSSSITFVKLPLPRLCLSGSNNNNNLPEGAEATTDVPNDQVTYLKIAYDALQQPISQFLKSSSPDWVLFDFSANWLPAIARDLGIPTAFFSILTAACLTYTGPTSPASIPDDRKSAEDYIVPPKWVPFPSTLALRLFEVLRIYRATMTGDQENVSDIYRLMEAIKGCDLIAIRSCVEFEPQWLRLLEEIHLKPVLPVGQLSTTECDDNGKWEATKEWLDRQPKGSVVYVAFGSEAMPSQDEITEIALGLELSELAFFWVLRTKRGSSEADLISLPEGFEERVAGRGVVCRSWAPQVKILSHDSVGVFLCHAGWSSVVEALTFGRALVLLTMSNDQGLNARILEEKKIGHMIPRDERDGSFTRESVAESLRAVIEKEEGRIFRDKAKELMSLFGDRDMQDMYVHNFLEHLKTGSGSSARLSFCPNMSS